MPSVASRDLWVVGDFFRRVQHNPAYKVPVFLDWSRAVDASGEELCSFRVWASEYNGEVSMVNPTPFPIYFGLHRREPWVAKDGFVFAEVGEEELEWDGGRAGPNVQNGIIAEVSTSVFCSVYIEQFSGFRKLFDRELEPFCIGEVHKVFGCSGVKESDSFGPFCNRMNKESNSHRFSCRHIYIRIAVWPD